MSPVRPTTTVPPVAAGVSPLSPVVPVSASVPPVSPPLSVVAAPTGCRRAGVAAGVVVVTGRARREQHADGESRRGEHRELDRCPWTRMTTSSSSAALRWSGPLV